MNLHFIPNTFGWSALERGHDKIFPNQHSKRIMKPVQRAAQTGLGLKKKAFFVA